jgi:uncharacterized damage-inducible protein DinB
LDVAAFRVFYQHNAWANRRVLEMAATVPPADYVAAVPGLSFGDLHATLRHILDSEWNWVSRLRGEPSSVWDPDLEAADLEALRSRWETEIALQDAYLGSLDDAALAGDATYEHANGERVCIPRWQVLYHLLTHSLQYRGEAAVRLTQLGASPGDLDLLLFLGRRRAG